MGRLIITAEKAEEARKLATEGKTRAEVADAIGITYQGLAKWARKEKNNVFRYATHKRTLTPDVDVRLRVLADLGYTRKESAKIIGASRGAVDKWSQNSGVYFSKRWHMPRKKRVTLLDQDRKVNRACCVCGRAFIPSAKKEKLCTACFNKGIVMIKKKLKHD